MITVNWVTNEGDIKSRDFKRDSLAFEFLVSRELISFNDDYNPIMVNGKFIRFYDNPYVFFVKVLGVLVIECGTVWLS